MRSRAVVFVVVGLSAEKQLSAVLPYLDGRHLALTSMSRDERAVVALSVDHLVEVVVCAVETSATDEIGALIAPAGGELAIVRPNPHRRHRETKAAASIQRAAEHGLDAVAIAAVLDLPIERVYDVLRPGRADVRRAAAYN